MLASKSPVDGAPELDLRELVEKALSATKDEGIAPEVEGRICTVGVAGPCLAVAPSDPSHDG